MAVKCPKCKKDNPETLRFCEGCGSLLFSNNKPVHNKIEAAPEINQIKESIKVRSIFQINHPTGGPWIHAIGKLFVNFGALELSIYVWICHLAKDELLHTLSTEMPFSKRWQLLEQLIERQDMPPKPKLKIRSVGKKIQKLSKLRNAVAHNPLVFGWHGPNKSGPPDFVGIPNLKRLKHSKEQITPLTNLKDLNIAINEIASSAQSLESAFAQFANSNPGK